LEPGDCKPLVGEISRGPVIPRFGFMFYKDNALTHLPIDSESGAVRG